MTGGSATFMQAGYSTIATSYSIGGATYDSTAHVPWIAVGGSSYLSWENPQSINDKVNYVKTNALGGWIIWVLGWDYSPGNSPQDPLLNAVSEAFRPKPPTGIQIKVN
jgi:GH18 family chitinase